MATPTRPYVLRRLGAAPDDLSAVRLVKASTREASLVHVALDDWGVALASHDDLIRYGIEGGIRPEKARALPARGAAALSPHPDPTPPPTPPPPEPDHGVGGVA